MHLLPELHLYRGPEPESAALNMAVDEALLENVTVPSLRFYSWKRPALSFGYFGAFADVADETTEREVVRRWTGGGIVPHGFDFTYSVILPAHGSRSLPASRVFYYEIHDAIRRALSPHFAVKLAAQDAPKLSAACFANPVTADVLANGEKIAGAAQRRTRAGLLHQGSIQAITLPESFPDAFARELCPDFVQTEFSAAVLQRARDLAAEKYGTVAWLRRR